MAKAQIPREKIPWYPSINYDLCKGKKECLNFCPNHVFVWDELAARISVANPNNCGVGCDNCVRICPSQAITFPDKAEFTATLRRLRAEMLEVQHGVLGNSPNSLPVEKNHTRKE